MPDPILVVEDEAELVASYERMLRRLGYGDTRGRPRRGCGGVPARAVLGVGLRRDGGAEDARGRDVVGVDGRVREESTR
jgi:hypothetical protein